MKYYDLVLSPRLRRGMTWALVCGAASAAAAVHVAGPLVQAGEGSVLAAAGLLGFVFGCAPIAAAGLVLYHLRETADQTHKLISIRPLLGELPPPIGGWSIDPRFGELIVQTISESRPRLVLECGAGSSTLLAAATLRALGGGGRVVTLENEPAFAELTRTRLRGMGLAPWSHVITAPLERQVVDGVERNWYRTDVLADIEGDIDLLVVDGPHGKGSRMARFPAVPLLRERLAPGCTILMDDGSRPDERRIAALWADMLGSRRRYFANGRGAWLLRQPAGR